MTMQRQARSRSFALGIVLAACLALPAGPTWSAQDVEADVTAQEDLEKEQEQAAIRKARSLAETLFYDVEITFQDLQPSAVKEMEQHFGYGWANSLAMRHSVDKRVLTLHAVLADARTGLFLMAEPDINFETVAGIELKTGSGTTYPLTPVAVMIDQSALLLRAEGFSLPMEMPAFAQGVIEDAGEVLVANVTRFGSLRDIRVRGARLARYLTHEDDLEMFALGEGLAGGRSAASVLLFDSEGSLAAIVVSQMLVRMDGRKGYFTQWPRAGDGISVDSLRQAVGDAAAEAGRYTHRIKFHFRQEEDDDSSFYYSSGYGEDVPEDEWIAYGLAVDATHIFIPAEIERNKIETIEAIDIELGPGREVEGEFAGVFKEFGGMFVRCPEPLEFAPDLFDERDISDMALFVDVSVKHRFGAKDALAKYNRFFGTDKGYKDKEFRQSQRPILSGSFVLDTAGGFYGFSTREKRYESVEDDDMSWRYGRRFYYASSGGGDERCFVFADVKDRFREPAGHFDPKVRVKRMQERKELAWLGVEFQAVTPELAKELGAEKGTRDGQYGLLVSLVYEGSPAQKMGIRPGDLLLRIQEEGKAGEHLLEGGRDRYYYDWGYSSMLMDTDFEMPFVDAGWFNRRNSLTQLLTTLGPGTAAVLTYSQDHEVKSAEFAIEKAPPDLNSADKYKSEWTGLTVKDITYEVRRIIRLGGEFEGVVVYEVEPGSPAAVGQITPMEFIEEIDGRKVAHIADFEQIVEALVASGRESATFKVRSLDESRFVEVQLEKPEEPGAAIQEILKRLPGMGR